MTLNDLKWLEWPFYVKFSLTNCHWVIICYIFTVEFAYTCDQRRSVGSGVVDRDP